jgi:hypothetical protein
MLSAKPVKVSTEKTASSRHSFFFIKEGASMATIPQTVITITQMEGMLVTPSSN